MSYRRRRGLGAVRALRRRLPDGRRWLWPACALAAGALVGYLIAARVLFPAPAASQPEGTVEVPEVVGEPEEEARGLLREVGLTPEVDGRVPSRTGAPGEVLAQRPLGGQVARAGDTVYVTTAAPARGQPVPRLRGLRGEEAEEILRALGFDVRVREEPSSAPEGAAVGTRPAAGTPVTPPDSVTLLVSEGQRIVAVPRLVGRHLGDVLSLLDGEGLELGAVEYAPGAGAAPGRIVWQSPPAGYSVRAGERVSVRVAGEPPDSARRRGDGSGVRDPSNPEE